MEALLYSMEGPSNSTLTGQECTDATQKQGHSSLGVPTQQQSVIDQLLPAESGTEGSSTLADSIDQILNEPIPLGAGMESVIDPAKLVGAASGFVLDLGSGTASTANPPPTATTSNSVFDQGRENKESATAALGLNIDQLASSIINSASTDPSSPTASLTESIMDQMGPPMVLPDLNVAMAEGMAANCRAEDGTGTDKPGTEGSSKESIALPGAIQSAVSNVSLPLAERGGKIEPKLAATSVVPNSAPILPIVAPSHTQHGGTRVVSSRGASLTSVTPAISQTLMTAGISASPVPTRVPVPPPTPAVTALPFSATIASSPVFTPKLASAVPSITSQRTSAPGMTTATSQFPPPSSVTPLASPSPSGTSLLTSVSPLAPSTSQSVSTSAATAAMLAKGLNLPLLQFLNLNFPSLKIKDLQDVLSINSLLTQVLKNQINTTTTTTVQQQQPSTEAGKINQPSTSGLGVVSASTTSASQLKVSETSVSSARLMLPKLGLSSMTSSSAALPRPSLHPGLSSVPSRASSPSGKTVSLLSPSSATTAGLSGLKAGLRVPVNSDGNLGINVDLLTKQSSSLLSSLSPSSFVPMSSSSSNRKAVLVQILNKTTSSSSSVATTVTTTPPSRTPIMIPRMKPLSKSPLILNRPGSRADSPVVVRTTAATATLALSVSTATTTTTTTTATATARASPPVSSLCVSLSLPALKSSPQEPPKQRKTPSRKSVHPIFPSHSYSEETNSRHLLSRTVVQPAESEAMEVDVGQPVQKLQLPKHLKDHSYSLYNPEEGERQRVNRRDFAFVSSIPPARLSYAPQVPDSPSTLHKLLKVNPKKSARQSPPRGRGRGGKSRGIKKSGGRGGGGGKAVRGRGASVMNPPTVEALSDEASSTEMSDSEDSSRKVG